jgi:hypothetical protein
MSGGEVVLWAAVTCVIALAVAGASIYWRRRPSLPSWQWKSLIVVTGAVLPSAAYWGLHGSEMTAMGLPLVFGWYSTASVALRAGAVTYATVHAVQLDKALSCRTAAKALSLSVVLGSAAWFCLHLGWVVLTASSMLRATVEGVDFPGWVLMREVPFAIGAAVLCAAVMSGVAAAHLFGKPKRVARPEDSQQACRKL